MTHLRTFASSSELQEVLLRETRPGTLIIIPHQRLARQLWHKQRLAALEAGILAWEPLPCLTLGAWWYQLAKELWLPAAPAPKLTRLRLWRQAIDAAPPLEGAAPDLTWAQALDEAHLLLARYQATARHPAGGEAPLLAWRRQVFARYETLIQEGGWLSPAHLPARLLEALAAGGLSLPETLFVVGLETPAPVEEAFLQALQQRTRVVHLRVSGHPQAIKEAWVLKDPQEELAWVAARLVERHVCQGIPLHRLAVTSPVMDRYAPEFRRMLRELLGPAGGEEGWCYNFSAGPRLADTPLFAAALLPLAFFAKGERREDLASLLLSPFYGRLRDEQGRLARFDRRFRELGLDRGWAAFRRAAIRDPADQPLARLLVAALAPLQSPAATAGEWLQSLAAIWQALGFPGALARDEAMVHQRLLALLEEVVGSLEQESLTPAEFLAWLTYAARQVELPGPGREEAGIQVLGLLEMRGLDFDQVFCLGLNSRDLPASPRPLPLLAPWEKPQVLGGTAASQLAFAKELFANLRGAAPHLVLTRPGQVEGEEQVATYLWEGSWQPAQMAPLSQPHPAWLRVPAVKAAFAPPACPPGPGVPAPISMPLLTEVRITHARVGLACPCRFLLEVLLEVEPLPEIDAGLPPAERGRRLHQVVARFVAGYGPVLAEKGAWDDDLAREHLKVAAREVLGPLLSDPHWQAEWDRWLGAGPAPGLLTTWLEREQERYEEGWRWVAVEAAFQGLAVDGCPFPFRGRLDRLDYHPESGELMVWDYKSGELPTGAAVFQGQEEFQLPGYLLAVRQGVVAAPEAHCLKAGFIGLKSTRDGHLKHEDYGQSADAWEDVLAAWEDRLKELARRLGAGDFSPAPTPAPEGRKGGACTYCPYPLLCGYLPEPADLRGVEE